MKFFLSLSLLLFLPFMPDDAQACSDESNCMVGERSYLIRMPEGHDGSRKVGALIYAHGFKGSPNGSMRNKSLAALANRLGVAFVALDSAGPDWSIPNVPSDSAIPGLDESAYLDAVRTDILDRFAIDEEKLVVLGFSAGGMLTWHVACTRPGDYLGFIPLSGTFWAPVPDRCEEPAASIVHIHGTADRIVPLAGRPIKDTKQGDIDIAISMYRDTNRFGAQEAPKVADNLSCEAWGDGVSATLVKCLHDGGHTFKADYIEGAWNFLTR
ncbi:MAG: polyhydroxybutyrate depolymerase [Pseudomonadota bacterium]